MAAPNFNGNLTAATKPFYDASYYGTIYTTAGTNDSAPAINAAINACPTTGGEVVLPAGPIYIRTPIVLKANVKLRGYMNGRDTTNLCTMVFTDQAIRMVDGTSALRFDIDGIEFDGGNVATCGIALGVSSQSSGHAQCGVFSRVSIRRINGIGLDTSGGTATYNTPSTTYAGSATNWSFYDVIVEYCNLNADIYGQSLFFYNCNFASSQLAANPKGGVRFNASSQAFFYGGYFGGNKTADILIAATDFMPGFACYGTWFEQSDCILARPAAPSGSQVIASMLFSGCGLSGDNTATYLMDTTNIAGTVVLDSCWLSGTYTTKINLGPNAFLTQRGCNEVATLSGSTANFSTFGYDTSTGLMRTDTGASLHVLGNAQIQFDVNSTSSGVTLGNFGSSVGTTFGFSKPGTILTECDINGNFAAHASLGFTNNGPTWTFGTGAPASTQPKGSMYSRTDGAVGTTLYVSQGAGVWNAVSGV